MASKYVYSKDTEFLGILKYPKKCLEDFTTCLLDEGIPKIRKKLNSHGGFLRANKGSAKMCCQLG